MLLLSLSAAGALVAGAAALRDLAAVEQQAHGHDYSSRLVEAGGDALRFLAAVEHRLGILMPELRLHDARMRIKQSARIAAREHKLVRTATQSAGGISSNVRRRQSAHTSRTGIGDIGDTLLQPQPEASEPSQSPTEGSPKGRRPSLTQQHAGDDVDGPSWPPELAGAPSAASLVAAPGAAAPPSAARAGAAARPASAATARRASVTPSATGERPRSAAALQRSRSAALSLPDSVHHHLSDVLEEVTHRKSEARSHNVRVQPYNDDEATGESKHMPAATQKDKDFLWRVFQAFDQDGSGSISVVEVRSLFDRMSLEASQKKKGLQGTSDKSFKAAHKFIAQLFDDELDGKLGKTELDRFFHIFNSDDSKLMCAAPWSTALPTCPPLFDPRPSAPS